MCWFGEEIPDNLVIHSRCARLASATDLVLGLLAYIRNGIP